MHALPHPPTVFGGLAMTCGCSSSCTAEDLDVDVTRVVPVCLAEGKIYNVDDALNAAMLRQQDAANRVRLLRCLRARRHEENWDLLWRQLGNAGRILLRLPGDRQPSGRDDRH